MSDDAQSKSHKESKIKPLDSYSEEELRQEGEKAIQKKLEALQRSQENFSKTKSLIYARKRRACAFKAVQRELEKYKTMRREEKQEVDKVNRDKKFRRSRYSSAAEMIEYLRSNVEELEDEDEDEDDEN